MSSPITSCRTKCSSSGSSSSACCSSAVSALLLRDGNGRGVSAPGAKAEEEEEEDASGRSRNHRRVFRTHLVLHFDLNETVLIGDAAGGDTRGDCFHKILAKAAFVRIPVPRSHSPPEGVNDWEAPHNTQLASVGATAASAATATATTFDTSNFVPTHWWDGTPIADVDDDDEIDDEHLTSSRTPPPPPPVLLHTAWEWPDGCCPYYRTAYKARASTFVWHHGAVYQPVYRALREALLPPAQYHNRHHSRDPSDGDDSSDSSTEVLSNMLPAFFETLVALFPTDSDPPHPTPTPTLVLRTFGSDLAGVAAAIAQFAQGRHPAYPDYSNDQLVLDPSALLCGRWVPTDEHHTANDNQDGSSASGYQYQLWSADERVLVAAGDAAVLDYIHRRTICAIRDDYAHWVAHDCAPWAGKPVWMIPHRRRGSEPDYHHILLDDNIHNLEHDGVASVRVASPPSADGTTTGFHTLSGRDSLDQHGLHLIRVPTLEPLLNAQWFVQQIYRARVRHAARYE